MVTSYEIRFRPHTGRVSKPVLGGDERNDGRGEIRRNARAEAILLLVDRLAKSFLGVHGFGPYPGEQVRAP